jgi:hypothetical protein
MTAPSDVQDEHRAVAIQCVAELGRGLTILEQEVIVGAGRRDVRDTINGLRRLLRVLEDATMRDGRWPGSSPRPRTTTTGDAS